MSTEKANSLRCRCPIWCWFGVIAVVVIVLWYVEVVPAPVGGDDSELTAKRVDRLSFFNASGGDKTVQLKLYEDDAWTTPWSVLGNKPMTAVDKQHHTIILGWAVPPDGSKEPLRSIKCTVALSPGVTRSCYIKAQEGLWIAAATFWFAKDYQATPNLRLCGEILQSDGTYETHEKEELND